MQSSSMSKDVMNHYVYTFSLDKHNIMNYKRDYCIMQISKARALGMEAGRLEFEHEEIGVLSTESRCNTEAFYAQDFIVLAKAVPELCARLKIDADIADGLYLIITVVHVKISDYDIIQARYFKALIVRYDKRCIGLDTASGFESTIKEVLTVLNRNNIYKYFTP